MNERCTEVCWAEVELKVILSKRGQARFSLLMLPFGHIESGPRNNRNPGSPEGPHLWGPRRAVRPVGERRRSAISEFSSLDGNEGYGACVDEVVFAPFDVKRGKKKIYKIDLFL